MNNKLPIHSNDVVDTSAFFKADHPIRNICLKGFVILVIAIGAIACITGFLSLLASQGILPNGFNSLIYLAKVGTVNSILMITGGFLFFVLGIVAWTCNLLRERRASF